MRPTPIDWTEGSAIRILDQTLLPGEERYLDLDTVAAMAEAIGQLRVRGAPLIGIAAAMGATLAGRGLGTSSTSGRDFVPPKVGRSSSARPGADTVEDVLEACDALQATRPTAVNLGWALERMRRCARAVTAPADLHQALVSEANAIWAEDRVMCRRIGEAGLHLVPDGATVMTHCNAGVLATGGIGTALAPIYLAQEAGRRVSVVADETRPLLQGSRLTAWELTRAGIPTTIIADGMAASRMARGGIACVLVGADRVARNGDVANKIGTYGLALAAHAHGIPFYVAAPRSTYDAGTADGAGIVIEERREEEVRAPAPGAAPSVPDAARVWNPAFDVTPSGLVTGYLTDAGLLTAMELRTLL